MYGAYTSHFRRDAAHPDLSLRSGRSQSALIREAIDVYLHQQQPQGRLARLRQGRGLWAERTDLPDWSALRSELDRAPADLSP